MAGWKRRFTWTRSISGCSSFSSECSETTTILFHWARYSHLVHREVLCNDLRRGETCLVVLSRLGTLRLRNIAGFIERLKWCHSCWGDVITVEVMSFRPARLSPQFHQLLRILLPVFMKSDRHWMTGSNVGVLLIYPHAALIMSMDIHFIQHFITWLSFYTRVAQQNADCCPFV